MTRNTYLQWLSPRGRSGRLNYLRVSGLVAGIFAALATMIPKPETPFYEVVSAVFALCFMVLAVIFAAASMRRFHDLGWSSKWMWGYLTVFGALHLVPAFFVFIGLMNLGLPIIWALLLVLPGSANENRYGLPIEFRTVRTQIEAP